MNRLHSRGPFYYRDEIPHSALIGNVLSTDKAYPVIDTKVHEKDYLISSVVIVSDDLFETNQFTGRFLRTQKTT